MQNPPILILSLAFVAQLRFGHGQPRGWGAYTASSPTMAQIGPIPRPMLLNSPSRRFLTPDSPISDSSPAIPASLLDTHRAIANALTNDLIGTGASTPSSNFRNRPTFDFAAMRKRQEDLAAAAASALNSPTPSVCSKPSPADTPYTRQPSIPRVDETPSQSAFRTRPVIDLGAMRRRREELEAALRKPVPIAESPNSDTPSSQPSTPPATPARTPYTPYGRPPLQRSDTFIGRDNVNAQENTITPTPQPVTPSYGNRFPATAPTPAKSSPYNKKPTFTGPRLNRSKSFGGGSIREPVGIKRQSDGSILLSEELPADSSNIDIIISGSGIDDERLTQMVKEAKNAITTVFHTPKYQSRVRGNVSFREL